MSGRIVRMPPDAKRCPEPEAGGRGGFTLIELLIVITVIGIIAAIAIPGLVTALNKSKQTTSAANLRQIGHAMEVYNSENATYPVTDDIDEALVLLAPFNSHLKSTDEWEHVLGLSSDGSSYTIVCYGLDGEPGAYVSPATRYVFTLDIVYSNGTFVAAVE
jgi:type II secretion system protein G